MVTLQTRKQEIDATGRQGGGPAAQRCTSNTPNDDLERQALALLRALDDENRAAALVILQAIYAKHRIRQRSALSI
jgi:hypothetical protein